MTKRRSARGGLLEFIAIIILALGLALGIQALVVKPYQIPSESMEPTLDVGQRVLVNRFIYRFSEPRAGDVVVFHPPIGAERGQQCATQPDEGQACPKASSEHSDQNFIKRIVAGPGDTLRIRDGHPVVNGIIQDLEPYITPCGGGAVCDLPKPIRIPADHYFMMGDNRGASDDSRFWGPVPQDWIIGKAFATYWPPNKIGLL